MVRPRQLPFLQAGEATQDLGLVLATLRPMAAALLHSCLQPHLGTWLLVRQYWLLLGRATLVSALAVLQLMLPAILKSRLQARHGTHSPMLHLSTTTPLGPEFSHLSRWAGFQQCLLILLLPSQTQER